MHLLSYLVAVVSMIGTVASAQRGAVTLDCSRKEALALREAPLGALRMSKHRLTVKWSAGIAMFRDSGVADGYLGGIGYEYCGYASAPGLHLINKRDDDLFTGVLLSHATGKIIPAGKSVSFAPDMSYFATAQPDGLDGEEWYIYSPTGVRRWKGLSGISAKHPTLKYDYFIATLEEPHWSAGSELQATLKCSEGNQPSTLVTLTRKNQSWVWLPPALCAPAK